MMWRYRVILFLLVGLFIGIIGRLFYWQVVKASELRLLGMSQYGHTLKIKPERGQIKTSDNFPIVTNKISYLVFTNPKVVKEKEKTTALLSNSLRIDSASVSAQLSQDLFWVPIKHFVSLEKKEEINAYKLPGIGFEEEFVRFYPESSMAAHVIGFVGKDENGEEKGYFGIEGYYDRLLRGKMGIATQITDAFGRPILARLDKSSGKIDGAHVILSIDRAVQFIVEKKLRKAIEKYEAAGGMVGIMEARTGNILSLASFPSFDQRDFQTYDQSFFKNPFISNVFEPGSTFKALVMASALDAKAVKADTVCDICQGPIQIGEYQIRTWNNKYYENSTMAEVIQHSDNTGMVFVSRKLGFDKLMDYLKKFGIGELSGIDLQGEVTPLIKPKEEWYPIDFATASFGQGISVTPIELLTAFASLASDGKRMIPRVVKAIEQEDGKVVEIKPEVINQPVSSETAAVMKEILVNAVEKGEAKWAKPKGYRIAGKTGTAQIPIEGKYDPEKTIASFIGFAPADDPKFVMLVIFDRPTTSIYGSETAAPVFFDIAKDLFAYYEIPPSE